MRSLLLPCWLVRAVVLGCAAAAPAEQRLVAQTAPPPPTAAAASPTAAKPPRLRLQNLAPLAREEGIAVVVPFGPGEVPTTPEWHVPDTPTSWQPFGLRWPDGSVRQALCLWRTRIAALAERELTLAPGAGPALPTGEFPPAPAELTIVARLGGREHRASVAWRDALEVGPLRLVHRHRGRVGDSGLVAELHLATWRDQAHAALDVAVFHSDPRSPALQLGIDELTVECRGMLLVLRHAGHFGITQQPIAGGSRAVLLQHSVLGDGQGLRRIGALLPLQPADAAAQTTQQAAATVPLLGVAAWRPSGAFGPFGVVPELPAWLQGEAARRYLAGRHRAFVDGNRGRGDPFVCFDHGLQRYAGQTGDQADFGVTKLGLVPATGLGSFLLEVEASVLQEACRPVHCFEVDGTPVDPARHPDWVVWNGRTHWHAGVAKDRLGKPAPEPEFERHGWTGKDREHWSSNFLGAYAQLTGEHWARSELANEARLYLAGQTIVPGWSTSNAGAPRGAGRTALAAAWMLLATGDQALRDRMDARMDLVYSQQWDGRDRPADQVRPMGVAGPDPRVLQGAHRYWNPWQDALAAIGFAAHHRVTGNPRARQLAEVLASNLVRHGWRVDERGHDVAAAIRWLDGEPFAAAQWRSDEPTLVTWSTGTGFRDWSIGAVEIARVVAQRDGDTVLQQKCEAIQQAMRATRQRPRDGGLDRFAEWDAVAWPPR
jgi:hypothetical protein